MYASVPRRVVVIGASAGGLPALKNLLENIDKSFEVPIVVVLHVPAVPRLDFSASFGGLKNLELREVEEKAIPSGGGLYIAPSGYHLLFERDGSFSLSNEPPVNWARPAADVLFETTASAFGKNALGIVLSGANRDGAYGLALLKKAGATTFVQDPKTAEVDSMPRAAIAISKPDAILSPAEMGAKISYWARSKTE